MWRRWGRLNCVCRPCPPLNSICSVRSHAAYRIKHQPISGPSLPPPSLHRFVRSPVHRSVRSPVHRSVTSFRRDSLLRCFAAPIQKNNKAVKVALLFLSYEQPHTPSTHPLTFYPPTHILPAHTSSGEAAEDGIAESLRDGAMEGGA